MAIAVEFDLTGVKPLLRALQSMPDAMRSRILVPAAQKAGRTLSEPSRVIFRCSNAARNEARATIEIG